MFDESLSTSPCHAPQQGLFVQDIAGRYGRSFAARSGDFSAVTSASRTSVRGPQEALLIAATGSEGYSVEVEGKLHEARRAPPPLTRPVLASGPGLVADGSGQDEGLDEASLTALGSSHAPTLASARMAERVPRRQAEHQQAVLLESWPCNPPPPQLEEVGRPLARAV